MSNVSVMEIIEEYQDEYIFLRTTKETAFWAMERCNRIGVPQMLLNSKEDWDTFRLLHEIGHMKTFNPKYCQARKEFEATKWAIRESYKYDIYLDEDEQYSMQEYVYSFTKRKDKSIYQLEWRNMGMPF